MKKMIDFLKSFETALKLLCLVHILTILSAEKKYLEEFVVMFHDITQ